MENITVYTYINTQHTHNVRTSWWPSMRSRLLFGKTDETKEQTYSHTEVKVTPPVTCLTHTICQTLQTRAQQFVTSTCRPVLP